MKYLILISLLSLAACAPTETYRGNPGLKGDPGTPAAPSQPCTVVQSPDYATITCPDGTQARIDNGAVGAPGSQGPIGSPGVPGSPGTVVTIVNLCPGVTVYPSAFVETALCIQGNLYGVYSANDGFLTYFPPGNYASNAIGSACNLTIEPNCVVSH